MRVKKAVADLNRAIHLLQEAKAALLWKDRKETPKLTKQRAAEKISQAIRLLRPHQSADNEDSDGV